MYIRQKDSNVVVKENGEAALADHPDLFEEVAGDIPDDATFLIYVSAEDDGIS